MTRESSRNIYQAIVEGLPHAVLLVDARCVIAFANRAASALFHVPPDRLRGISMTALLPDGGLDDWLRDFTGRRVKTLETSLPPRGRGRPARTIDVIGVRLPPGGDRRREYRLLVIEDVSENTMLETQLVETEKQAAMGQLAAGLLHEVRNPVTSLGSNLLFVRNTLAPADHSPVAEALDVSLDHIDRMQQLLGTLSVFRRRAVPRFERADVHDILRQCLRFIARDAERRGIAIAPTLSPGPIECEMDVRSIKQVLLNLFTNAMEAMPSGGRLEVRTSRRAATLQEPAAAIIHVEDTGAGITSSDLRRVFRPLFSTKPRGAGLGLSFCRQTVEEHGGEIGLSSAGPGAGTVARVTLPVYQQTAEEMRIV